MDRKKQQLGGDKEKTEKLVHPQAHAHAEPGPLPFAKKDTLL